MYYLDTNSIIYFFRGQGNLEDNFLRHSYQDMAIPSVVLYELQVGILKSTNPKKRQHLLLGLLAKVDLVSFGEKEALATAEIRANLEQKGTPIGKYDLQIAGTALANNATLVTHNTKEFSRVEGLELVDWF